MKTKRPAPKRKPKHTTASHAACQQRHCSASVPLPICLLRMVVQVEDTPANRAELSVAKARLLRDSTFDGVQNVVKMEQLAVISLSKPNDRISDGANAK
jgi:hypothetical protein